jgi:uncharacterized zinc-type alcohol dehydrogenase-like protein
MNRNKSSSKIHGYVAKKSGELLKPFTYPAPELGEHDVRVSITHCGVCHSDVSAIDDYYGITKYPFVPGHEIVGYVTKLGNIVSELKEGDRVGIGWQGRSCMKCEWCLKGEEHLCMDIVDSATWTPYGGFSSSIIADSRFVYPIPNGLRSEVAAVLLCAGVTVYAPLRDCASGSDLEVGVVGIGGLGHLAIQFAHVMGYKVTAISSSSEKNKEALAFGADHFISLDDKEALRKLEFGLDLLLCTASAGVKWEEMLSILKKKGKLVLLGFPPVSLHPVDLVAHELSITGSFLGSRAVMQEMLKFAQKHGIKPMIELMPMSQVNEAIERVRQNKAHYRIVLTNKRTGVLAVRSSAIGEQANPHKE